QISDEKENRFVRKPQVARESERGLAFDLVAEEGDGCEVGFERELVRSKERFGGNREIGLARAATKTGSAVRATTIVSVQAAALWADRCTVCLRPAHLGEHGLRLNIRHREHLIDSQFICKLRQ